MKPELPAIIKSPGPSNKPGNHHDSTPEMKPDGMGLPAKAALPVKSSVSPSPSFYEAAYYWILSR